MQESLSVPVSSQGLVTAIISAGTIISSMMSDKMIRKFGTGKVTAVSVGMTAAALFGFSVSGSFWMLCVFAVPYGLGAGSVDAALNNFVALIQIVLTAFLIFSLSLWKRVEKKGEEEQTVEAKQINMKGVLSLTGAKQVLVAFFCYCSVEATTGLWGSSYFVMNRGVMPETAAKWAAIFYLGVTIGRFLCGFLSMRICEKNMIRCGQVTAALGVVLLLLPGNGLLLCTGYILIGLGCAPIYPALLHETPENFGREVSQGIMGMQMACAYLGTTLMPPLFGLIAQYISIAWYPFYLLILLVLMAVMTEYINYRLK